MIDEPVEGRYDFSRCEELISHAGKLDLGVYLGLTCEQAPGWLYRKHPECRMIGRDGLAIAYEAQSTLPADGKPGPCFDHPGAMADQIRFITHLVKTLGRFENIVVWNTWQEIGYWAQSLVGRHVCYCPNTLAHYRRWLRETYGDIDRLNSAWNTRYANWQDVIPERTTAFRASMQDSAWRYFMDNIQIGAVLEARAAAIREADALKRPVFAHKGGPIIGAGHDWNYARCQDFLGSSAYPAWGCLYDWDDGYSRPFAKHTVLLGEMWYVVALRFDYIRCANPPGKHVWAAEFQGGPVSTGFHKGRVPSPEDVRRWMLTAIGSGVTGISFWVARAEIASMELNGFGLLDSTGETTPRLSETSRIGHALNRYSDLLSASTKPRAQVAILVDEWKFQIATGLGAANHLTYSLRGWYRRLWDAGIPVDFLDTSELMESYAGGYKVLILAFPLVLSEETARRLADLTHGGTSILSDALPGRIDGNGYATRGEMSATMVELFGATQSGCVMVREPGGGTRWSFPERTWGEYLDPAVLLGTGPLARQRLRANVYLQTFSLTSGLPVLKRGKDIVGVYRKVGDGHAWLLGTFAGHGGTAYRDPASSACILRILALCGVRSDAAGRLLRQRRSTTEREAWILTNPAKRRIVQKVDVHGFKTVTDALTGKPLAVRNGAIFIELASLDVAFLVLERDEGARGRQKLTT